MTTGILPIDGANGMHEAELYVGVSNGMNACVAHNVINANHCEFIFVEVKIKT